MLPTQAYYDALARFYDSATSGDAWTPNHVLISDLATTAISPRTILDLGAGTGQTASALAAMYPTATITAVDISSGMLAHIANNVPTATSVHADIASFVRENTKHYDLVVAMGCLEFLPQLTELLPSIVARATRRGTVCFTYEPLIERFGMQSERENTLHADIGGKVTFTTYRYELAEIHSATQAIAEIAGNRLFVSYRRGDADVIYNYLRIAPRP